jgi:hypothetical protein
LPLAFVAYAIVLLEVAARAFLALEWQVPFFQPRDVIYRYYPELERVVEMAPHTDDGHFDVLILGASVVNEVWSNISELLAAGYTYRETRPVRVHNLSRPAHSSLDSYYKYSNLADTRFDLVVLYHGINEVRANNAPADVYRDDYSHYHWYDQVNRVHAHPELGVLAFPYVLGEGLMRARKAVGIGEYIALHRPRKEWVEHGADVKTAPAFRRNMERIIELARLRGDPLVLMTFAWFVPEGGWPDRFEVERSEWGARRARVRLWGEPPNVVAALEAHNQVILELAAENPDVIFVDQRRLLTDEKQFADICHLTRVGCRAFADHVLEATRSPLQARDASLR